MKNKRTRLHNADGSIVYNTFNSTGLTNQYKNINARFNTKYGTKQTRERADNETPGYGPRNSCTIAGCGKECCSSTLLLSDISFNQWKNDGMPDTPGFNWGLNLEPGHNVFLVNSLTRDSKSIGRLEDIVITNTNDCIAFGAPPTVDCSGAFPINLEIFVDSGPNGCRYVDINIYNQVWVSKSDSPVKNLGPITEQILVRKPGVGRVGAPYRAPIAGYRKSLDCCVRTNKFCDGKCFIKFSLQDGFSPPGSSKVGDRVYYQNKYFGEVIFVNWFPIEDSIKAEIYVSPLFDPKSNNNCHSNPGTGFTSNETVVLENVLGEIYQTVRFAGVDTSLCAIKPVPFNDVYKDPAVKSCGKDNRVCYNGRIRSGMQPKQQFCIEYKKVSENSYKKHKKLLCPTDIGWQKPYSFSYSQYNKNRALNTYKRGLERNIPANGSGDTSCPPGSCLKSLYRKSAGNSCLNCNLTACKKQTVDVPWRAPEIWSINEPVYILQTENGPGTNIGTLTGFKEYTNGTSPYTTLSIALRDCNTRITNDIYGIKIIINSQEPSLTIASSLLSNISDPILSETELSKAKAERKRMSRNSMTVWKPSNDKFKVQGAVTSGGRLERLKLDTIKSANSKCRKGQRCDKNGNGKGKYFAGKPRFDGWMFNKRHHEVVCENKYRQQPLGIPQLTYKGRSTRSNKPPSSWKDKSEGTYGLYQRDTITTRAPACKCSKKTCPAALCQGENPDNLPVNNARYQISRCRTLLPQYN